MLKPYETEAQQNTKKLGRKRLKNNFLLKQKVGTEYPSPQPLTHSSPVIKEITPAPKSQLPNPQTRKFQWYFTQSSTIFLKKEISIFSTKNA